MDLAKGFQIEEPNFFIPWEARETEFQQQFKGLQLCRVTDGYFTTHCISLSGLSHELGFHFYPQHTGNGKLLELEFFHISAPDLAASYEEFQRHLEQTFGSPALTRRGSEGCPPRRIPGFFLEQKSSTSFRNASDQRSTSEYGRSRPRRIKPQRLIDEKSL